jgi:hypothetical protein
MEKNSLFESKGEIIARILKEHGTWIREQMLNIGIENLNKYTLTMKFNHPFQVWYVTLKFTIIATLTLGLRLSVKCKGPWGQKCV